ncbi:unnamed protein product, partial [Hapterophycus canaliculatus]
MERDMLVRKFQKENLDDLFAVIRKNLSGMRCLARFAEEQRMGGEVEFFIEVEEFQNAEAKGGDNDIDEERKMQHAESIVSTYISPSASGLPGLIYTSEAQRKAVAAKIKRLWRKDRPKRRKICSDRNALDPSNESRSRGDAKENRVDGRDPTVMRDGDPASSSSSSSSSSSPEGQGRGKPSDDDRGDGAGAVRHLSLDAGGGIDGDGGSGGGVGVVGEDGCGDADGCNGNGSDDSSPTSARWSTSSCGSCGDGACGGGGGDGGGIGSIDDKADLGGEDPQGRQKNDRRGLSRSLFDEILDQNAIPTIRQNIVPKFIQSTYYELFLAELFPQVGVANAAASATKKTNARAVHLVRGSMIVSGEEEVEIERGERCDTSCLEDLCHDPEALAEKISEAVEAARKVAAAAATAAAVAGVVAMGDRSQ